MDDPKSLVTQFFEETINKGDLDLIDTIVAADLIQHDAGSADGAAALREAFAGLRAKYPSVHLETKRVIREGDLVVLHAHVVLELGSLGVAIVFIVRVVDGKIVEEWEVVQPVPETTASGRSVF